MTPLTKLVARLIFPAGVFIAITHLLEAETGPGDGFTAGIISALALTLQYELFGYHQPSTRPKVRFETVLLSGLVLVVAGALMPLTVGSNLMSPMGFEVDVPLIGLLRFTQANLFDLGLALVVFGGTMTAIDSLRLRNSGRDTEPDTEEEIPT